jgi:hypothetical protein
MCKGVCRPSGFGNDNGSSKGAASGNDNDSITEETDMLCLLVAICFRGRGSLLHL